MATSTRWFRRPSCGTFLLRAKRRLRYILSVASAVECTTLLKRCDFLQYVPLRITRRFSAASINAASRYRLLLLSIAHCSSVAPTTPQQHPLFLSPWHPLLKTPNASSPIPYSTVLCCSISPYANSPIPDSGRPLGANFSPRPPARRG